MGGEEQHFTCTEFCVEINLRVQVSGDGGAAVLVPLGCTEWASLCHLQVCVQGQPEAGSVLLSLVTDITGIVAVALLEQASHSLATILSSVFFIAGIIPALSFEPSARQVSVVQLREMPVPYSAKHQVLVQAVTARKTHIPNASKPETNVLYW